MDFAEFRRYGHEFVDWMADYLGSLEERPVRAPVVPGEIAARLPAAPPQEPEPMEAIFEDFKDFIVPGVTHWQHPGFFAFFPANSSPPSVLAEMLTATLGVQGMVWQTGPAATELEVRVMDWLRQMIGLPEGFAGVIQDTASTATLVAILTAREVATDFAVNEQGLGASERLVVYASHETHSSAEKDVKIAGLGWRNLRTIETDEDFAMRPEALEAAIAADIEAGLKPICVVASIGATGVGAMDPLRPIGEICRRHGLWLHVDAAWAGSALVLPEMRGLIDGIEYVDSFVFNPHKWLFTNFDCSAYFVRDPEALVRTFSIERSYLKTAQDDEVVNYRDWGIPLGRRFRALKLWFVIRRYGVEGLRARIRAHIALAEELERWISAADGFELMAPRRLALVCFRYHPAGTDDPAGLDRLNGALIEALNATGEVYFTQATVRGALIIRVSIGQTYTERRHVVRAWELIRERAAALDPIP